MALVPAAVVGVFLESICPLGGDLAAENSQGSTPRSRRPRGLALGLVLIGALSLVSALWASPASAAASYRDRPPQDEVIYFLLPDRFENGDPANDRGGLTGDRLHTGFDPSDPGFYHGGDLKGLISRLDYIQGLGATAIWLGPIFRNKPVQTASGHVSAGYHGYWITDFTRVDPHFGDAADMTALVDAAHARGLKVYMDIVVNHTADVIAYRECPASPCPYRSRADFPYSRRGGLAGPPINPGFLGDNVRTEDNFARLTDPTWAYTPYIPAGEEHAKTPAWLNDIRLYHNRGDSTFRGESSTFGDFVGLDDLMTENPRVIRGFIDIYGDWIDRYGVDGFRIDTARHVNPEFWQAFVPAMLSRAQARGIPYFHIFGEVATDQPDTSLLAEHTRVDGLPSVLDFAFRAAVIETVAKGGPTRALERVFAADALYEGGAAAALRLPTFVSNHDGGRFGWFARRANPGAADAEILGRVTLAYAMLLTLRGAPVIYSGDEQGYAGDGGDDGARQNLFASQVPKDAHTPLIGSDAPPAASHFGTGHPLYRTIAELSALRRDHAALRRGLQITRAASDGAGLLAVSRIDPDTGLETVIAFNTSTAPITINLAIDARTRGITALHGACPAAVAAPGSLALALPALDYAICAADPHP
jgi:glycosidase